ncbi:MAG: tRNA lysidine(34) synthetase TilS [Alphaproteobacteria bacterium]|nr:tRNA lysidine(34) synthetase TilS [Alphaproteobacteria bacterium]
MTLPLIAADQKIHDSLTGFIRSDDEMIAVAVSGGGDSMALLLAMHHYIQKLDLSVTLVALTVDHKLRADAAVEAAQVAKWCQKLGVEHHILEWKFEQMPSSGVQQKARDARYQLMGEFCTAQHIEKLFVGHNLEDNAETFLMRLKRGAGLSGLGSIAQIMQRNVNGQLIEIIRPFLSLKRADLREYLRQCEQAWFDDVSNLNEKFERVQIRKFLSENEVLENENVAQSASRLARADDALEFYLEEFWQAKVDFLPLGIAHVRISDFAALPEELQLRLLARLIWTIGGQDNPPRWQKIEYLWQQIAGEGRQFCLGHCLVVKKQQSLWFGYEDRQGFDDKWHKRFGAVNLSQKSVQLQSLSMLPEYSDPLLERHKSLKLCPKVILQSIGIIVADGKVEISDIDLELKIRR